MNDLRPLFDRLPVGWSVVVFEGRRYGVTRTVHGEGRSQSVYAEALDGSDVVSANLYDVGEGILRPCEMPEARVLAFLRGQVPDPDPSA